MSFGHKFIKMQDTFYQSKWAFISFISFSIFFALLQLILFLTNILPVVGTNDVTKWGPWVYMVISPFGTAMSLIGMVLTIRIDKKFFYPAMIGQIITMVSSFLSGMVFTGLFNFVVIYSFIYRFIKLQYYGANYKIWKYFVPTAIVANILMAIIFMWIAATPEIADKVWFVNKKFTDKIWYRELDVFSCFIASFGQIFLYIRNRCAFYWFLMCNFLFVALFVVSSAWMSALYIAINILNNIASLGAWTYRQRHPEEFE